MPYVVFAIVLVAWSSPVVSVQTRCGRPNCDPLKPKSNSIHRRHRHRGSGRTRVKPPPPPVEPKANLTIITEPGSEVASDVMTYGMTDENGILLISVKPDNLLVLTATKPGYEPGKGSISLKSAESGALLIKLTPKPGKLSIIPSVAGSDILVTGLGEYKDRISELKVTPGNYSIKVSRTCYQSEEQQILIAPAEVQIRQIPLTLQPMNDLLNLAESNWRIRNFDNALTAVNCILESLPDHPRANFIKGSILYSAEDYQKSTGYLVKALMGGEQIKLPVAYHSGSYHQGYLLLSQQSLEFHAYSQGGPDLSIVANKILEGKLELRKGYYLRITVGMSDGRKEGRQEYDFHPARGTAKNSHCPTCGSELEVLLSLVLKVK